MNFKPIAILLLVCLVMLSLIYTGPSLTYDDSNYLLFAHQIANGNFDRLSNPYAYGWLLPLTIAVPIKLGLSTSLPAQIEYILIILFTYLIARKVSKNESIAFCVGIIAATSAFIVGYSSRILPDLLIGLFITMAVYFMLDNRHPFFIGTLFGIVAFVKLGALPFAGIFFIALLMLKNWNYATWFILGVLLMLGIYLWSMNFATYLFQLYDTNQLALDHATLLINVVTIFVLVTPVLYTLPHGAFWQIFPLGFLFDLGVIGAYVALLKKERQYYIWAFILIAGFIYLMFGTESFSSYQPITVVSRYFVIFVGPLAILCSRFLTGIYDFVRYRYSLLNAKIILSAIVTVAILSQAPMLYYFHGQQPTYTGAPIINNG